MKISDYSHKHGKELVQMLHHIEYNEIIDILTSLESFPHGNKKLVTLVSVISKAFLEKKWEIEKKIY